MIIIINKAGNIFPPDKAMGTILKHCGTSGFRKSSTKLGACGKAPLNILLEWNINKEFLLEQPSSTGL